MPYITREQIEQLLGEGEAEAYLAALISCPEKKPRSARRWVLMESEKIHHGYGVMNKEWVDHLYCTFTYKDDAEAWMKRHGYGWCDLERVRGRAVSRLPHNPKRGIVFSTLYRPSGAPKRRKRNFPALEGPSCESGGGSMI